MEHDVVVEHSEAGGVEDQPATAEKRVDTEHHVLFHTTTPNNQNDP